MYDVIVIGGGHAGSEAALASARMGSETLLVTMNPDMIGFMSCNPAVGGIGKGQLVKELDALGGEMGRATDYSTIQFRMLNASKGPAVRSSRAQVDRMKYALYMKKILSKEKHLQILASEVTRLIVEKKVINGIEVDTGKKIEAKTVILTPGTFLNGLIHVGMNSFQGGRIEEKKSSKYLSRSLGNLGFKILRFKTGTCARLEGNTIDFSKTRIQKGDDIPSPFSFSTTSLHDIKQLPCYITYTNKKTHDIVLKNLDRSPLYSGKIIGRGVRYCPSLEDKVVRFAHHSRHQVFLEPEGENTSEYYPNGISTSLPQDVQEAFIRTIPGLEKVKINRFGYGIEHDVIDPLWLYPTLETRIIKNLYFAGQINGTTGYEEAASQGLVAGINASLRVKGEKPLTLDRSTSYIGVMLDDLVTKGTNEPYRMFTSRVEYRLILREDNADMRLRKIGHRLGLVKEDEYKKTLVKQKEIDETIKYLKNTKIKTSGSMTLFRLLKRPENTFDKLKTIYSLNINLPRTLEKAIESEIKYDGYIKRQLSEIRRFKNVEKIKIPASFEFDKIPGLSNETREKLTKFRPLSLGQASRIQGITPVAISILMVYLKK